MRFPFGEADVQNVTSAATINLTVVNAGLTYVRLSTLGANATINVSATGMVNGAELLIEIPSDGTARNVTAGTGLQSPGVSGVINKTKVARFLWIIDKFIQVGEQLIN